MSAQMKRKRDSSSDESERMRIEKAILALHKSRDAFTQSTTKCDEMINEIFGDLDRKLEHKKRDLNEIEEEYTRKLKSRKLDVEHEIKAYRYDAAKSILKEQHEVPISEDKLEELQDKVDNCMADADQKIEAVKKEERKQADLKIEQFNRTTKLQQEAAVAKVTAQLEQKDQQIKVLQDTIQGLKKEVEAQRSLTKQVAEYSRPVVQQHYPSSK